VGQERQSFFFVNGIINKEGQCSVSVIVLLNEIIKGYNFDILERNLEKRNTKKQLDTRIGRQIKKERKEGGV
jgi:hypothetical protein